MTGFASKRQAAWDKFADPWNGIGLWEEIENILFYQLQPAQKTATGIQYAQGIPFFIPPQRPWVELTDEEIIEIRQKTFDAVATNYEVYRAIEAKLKEKNS